MSARTLQAGGVGFKPRASGNAALVAHADVISMVGQTLSDLAEPIRQSSARLESLRWSLSE